MHATAKWIENLSKVYVPPSTDPLAQGNVAPVWNLIIAGLATPEVVPIPRVNRLAKLGWKVIGSLVTPMSTGLQVNSLHFMPAIGSRNPESLGTHMGNIFVPPNWLLMVATDPCMQVGAATYMLSQVRDFWNEKIGHDYKQVHRRAVGVEANVLHHLAFQGVLAPNQYQKQVLEAVAPDRWPDWYDDDMPFDMTRAKAKFRCMVPTGLREPNECPTLEFH